MGIAIGAAAHAYDADRRAVEAQESIDILDDDAKQRQNLGGGVRASLCASVSAWKIRRGVDPTYLLN